MATDDHGPGAPAGQPPTEPATKGTTADWITRGILLTAILVALVVILVTNVGPDTLRDTRLLFLGLAAVGLVAALAAWIAQRRRT